MFYSYVIPRDFGFAPNPFHGICSLATCKQDIRKSAQCNDWIFGFGSAIQNCQRKIVYAMKVTKKITFNEYYNDPLYYKKKPILNGSLKMMYGDNIYYYNEEIESWHQSNSHHSNTDGSVNLMNLERDTKSKYLLLSKHFYYWGRNCISIPSDYESVIHTGIGYRSKAIDKDIANQFIIWLAENFELGYLGDPIMFDGQFKRYDGR